VAVGADAEPGVQAVETGEFLQLGEHVPDRFVERQAVHDEHAGGEDLLFDQVRQALLQPGDAEALGAERHDEPVRQERFPELIRLRRRVPGREVAEDVPVPEAGLVDRLVQADVEHIALVQHGVERNLHHERGLADPGAGKHAAELAGRQDVFGLSAEKLQGVAQGEIGFQHGDITLLDKDDRRRGPADDGVRRIRKRPGSLDESHRVGDQATFFFCSLSFFSSSSAMDCGTCL
jgi:hypothetical protein